MEGREGREEANVPIGRSVVGLMMVEIVVC